MAFETWRSLCRATTERGERGLDVVEKGPIVQGKVPLSELGDGGTSVTPLSEVERQLGRVEQIHNLDTSLPAPPRQIRRLDRRRQRLPWVILDEENAHAEPRQRLFTERTGFIGQGRHPSRQHDRLPVTPKVEESERPCADCSSEQFGVVELLGKHEGRLGPLQRPPRR